MKTHSPPNSNQKITTYTTMIYYIDYTDQIDKNYE